MFWLPDHVDRHRRGERISAALSPLCRSPLQPDMNGPESLPLIVGACHITHRG
jgi:hypothetical protein